MFVHYRYIEISKNRVRYLNKFEYCVMLIIYFQYDIPEVLTRAIPPTHVPSIFWESRDLKPFMTLRPHFQTFIL